MNILHHKSWHVRNKDNILKVKKDEENARKEEEEKLRRVALAESEARTDLLRKQASEKREVKDTANVEEPCTISGNTSGGHINFFSDLEEGKKDAKGNKEYEKEKREEKEKYEKKIGLLVGLGQSAVEGQDEKPWYLQQFGGKRKREEEEEITHKRTKQNDEFNKKFKKSLDPLHMMNKYLDTKKKVEDPEYKPHNRPVYKAVRKKEEKPLLAIEGPSTEEKPLKNEIKVFTGKKDKVESKKSHKKHKKDKKKKKKKHKHQKKHKRRKHSSSDDDDSNNEDIDSINVSANPEKSNPGKTIQELRAERLRREKEERLKAKKLMDKMSGKVDENEKNKLPIDDRSRAYNSLFNPEFVRKPKRRRTDYSDFS